MINGHIARGQKFLKVAVSHSFAHLNEKAYKSTDFG